ncbi:MAG: HAD hydrolase-like protein, partial [Clostridia bacterium]|nr:HAD hydrolase-like protein [Clostridia bacterium]
MRKIKAVILDWSGTLVDYGCMATEENYREIFQEYGIELTTKEIRTKMGIEKVDHIRSILESKRISELWLKNTGMEPNEGDVRELNRHFEYKIFEKVEKYSAPKEHVVKTLETLRDSGIKIGSTTSYSTEVMDFLTKLSAKNGIITDCWINSDQVKGQGRPNPFMIFKNMEKMG